MAWVEKDHNDHLVSSLLLCAGSSTTTPGCPEPHPAWPWMPPWMGHPQPPWATWFQCVTTLWVKNFLLISNLSLPCLSLKPFPLVLSLYTLVNSHISSCKSCNSKENTRTAKWNSHFRTLIHMACYKTRILLSYQDTTMHISACN